MSMTAAIAAMRSGDAGSRRTIAVRSESVASPPSRAWLRVGVRSSAAHVGCAAPSAMPSSNARTGCAADAMKRASVRLGAHASARKRVGCSSVMSGAAMRFAIGAMMLTVPKYHAIIGVEATLATTLVTSSLRSARLHPPPVQPSRRVSRPLAASENTPSTDSCQPRSRGAAESTRVGRSAPSVRTENSEAGRCRSRAMRRLPNMTPARTAGGGSPRIATYTAVMPSARRVACVCESRAAVPSRSSAAAMIATWTPETESM